MNKDRKLIIKQAALKLLRPIVQILIKNEISHSELSEFAKEIYVEVANDHFSLPKKKNTVSRLAILTGLSRKEVVRLTDDGEQVQQKPKLTPNRAARVVTGWISDKDFLNDQQQPKVIPFKSEPKKTKASFTDLVERYSGDITARAILDELVRLDIVSVVDKQNIRLEKMGYIPNNNDIESIGVLSDCASNLLHTGVFNLNQINNKEKKFQRQLSHRDIPLPVAEEFKTVSQEKSLSLLLELDQWLNHKISLAKPNNDSAVERVGLGIYYFEDKDHEGTEIQRSYNRI